MVDLEQRLLNLQNRQRDLESLVSREAFDRKVIEAVASRSLGGAAEEANSLFLSFISKGSE